MAEICKICRLTNLTGKPIITQDTGRRLGSVKDIIYDPNTGQLDAVTIETSGFFAPHRWFLLVDDIDSLGEDAVMVRSPEVLRSPNRAAREERTIRDGMLFMGKSVVTQDGTLLGSVSDVVIDPSSGKATRYEVSGGALRDIQAGRRSFPMPEAIVAGTDALIVPDSVEQELQAEPAGGMAGAYAQTATGAAGLWGRVRAWSSRTSSRAGRATAEREEQFSLGKTAGSTVQDDDGNIIVAEGEEITSTVVVRARAAGKLHQLALSAGWGATRAGYESARDRVTAVTQEREEAYVVGKDVDRTIRDDQGEVIIRSGGTVTQAIAAQARLDGKLADLVTAVATAQLKSGSGRASEEAQGWLAGMRQRAGAAGMEIGERRLTTQQREMATGKVSATDIVDKEGSIIVREGEIFTPMMLSHLEEEGLLDQIHLKPVMGTERAAGETGAPCIELVVRAEDVRPK